MVLLQETTLDGGRRWRSAFAPPWRPGAAHGTPTWSPCLTLSQGIAQWRPGGNLVMLLERVDGALYRSQEAQGATVVSHRALESAPAATG